MSPVRSPRRARVQGHTTTQLEDGWTASALTPDAASHPDEIGAADWYPATVPGTAASVLAQAGIPIGDLDNEDWWFRSSFQAAPADERTQTVLHLDGIATVSEVFLNGERIIESDSMFARHTIDIGTKILASNELAIRCRALGPQLRRPRKPRARWRTRVVADGNLRWKRTMLLGRAPGFAPGPPAVGPWRPVRIEQRRSLVVERLDLRPRLDDGVGFLDALVDIRSLDGRHVNEVDVEVQGPGGTRRVALDVTERSEGWRASGVLHFDHVHPWWPHTHGESTLYRVRLHIATDVSGLIIDAGSVGFRKVRGGPSPDHDIARDGLDLHINGTPIFARGAVWTPTDMARLTTSPDDLRSAIQAVRDAGMNVLRVPGVGTYEQDAFHDLCDELGVLVWQDFMFANMDYPFDDPGFRSVVLDEVGDVLDGLAGRPSLVVLCGNSEIEQQVAMLGLDPALGRDEFFETTLPGIATQMSVDAVYLPSAPFGGDLPFRVDRGVANYFGVGAYRRPLSDARMAGLRFAAECLAFANVPDEDAVDALMAGSSSGAGINDARWKAGVPRDVGSGWDFDDVRDHYFNELFGLDPGEIRRVDPARYLELSRCVSGEMMAETFGEWRRMGSSCRGAIVLWWRDLVLGAGWGLVDNGGHPKVAYHYLRRALAPVAVWMTDEGLGGVVIHVANDRPMPLETDLRVTLYQGQRQVAEARELIEIGPHSGSERNVEAMLGRFVDAAWAYRFGPPGHDVIVACLEPAAGQRQHPGEQSFVFPSGLPIAVDSADDSGLCAIARPSTDGTTHLSITTRRLAYGIRIHATGFLPDDDAFSLEPGGGRTIVLTPAEPDGGFRGGTLTAINVQGRIPIEIAL